MKVSVTLFASKACIAARVLLRSATPSFVLMYVMTLHMALCIIQLFFQPVFC